MFYSPSQGQRNEVLYGTLRITAINPLKTELNPICHLVLLLGGATAVVVSRLRVNRGTLSFSHFSVYLIKLYR